MLVPAFSPFHTTCCKRYFRWGCQKSSLLGKEYNNSVCSNLWAHVFSYSCEKCQEISKVLEEIADAFSEPELMVAVINCGKNKQTCKAENVSTL